jgi:hypothetical protein
MTRRRNGLKQISALKAIKFMCMTFDPMMFYDGDMRDYQKGFGGIGWFVAIVQRRLGGNLGFGISECMRSLCSQKNGDGSRSIWEISMPMFQNCKVKECIGVIAALAA